MKTQIIASLILLFGIVSIGFTQEKSKKQIREEIKLEKQKKLEALVNSKEFVFDASMVFPNGGRSFNIAGQSYSVEFYPTLIKSYLPFFGRGFSGIAYGGDGGIIFESVPKDYTIKKEKKNFEITAEVVTEKDTYKLFLSISFDGGASLSIISNNRSSISYNGLISKIQKKENSK